MEVNAMNVDAKYIKELNDKVARYNMERQKQLGIVEAAKQSFESGLANYNATYNTQLTAETLPEELNRVSAELESEAKNLEKLIETIETGAYKEAKSAPTPVSVTATDGTLLTSSPMPSPAPSPAPVAPVVLGVEANGQNGTQPSPAPSTAIPSPMPFPAVNAFTGFGSPTSVPQPAPQPTPQPVPQPISTPSPAPAGFGTPIPMTENANIPAPGWANSPTSAINNQFAEMLGGKFNPNA
jgi:hypothetical protein